MLAAGAVEIAGRLRCPAIAASSRLRTRTSPIDWIVAVRLLNTTARCPRQLPYEPTTPTAGSGPQRTSRQIAPNGTDACGYYFQQGAIFSSLVGYPAGYDEEID